MHEQGAPYRAPFQLTNVTNHLQLDGSMAGDVGFDPLGLSNIDDVGLDLYWMREAELKHGRLAMMAVAGVVWVETLGSFPGMVKRPLFLRNALMLPKALTELTFLLFALSSFSPRASARTRWMCSGMCGRKSPTLSAQPSSLSLSLRVRQSLALTHH